MTEAQGSSPIFGPAWAGWESYRLFAESVKTDLRYVRSPLASEFLKDVRGSCESRKLIIPKGSIYWRARLGCEEEVVTVTKDDEISVSHIEERPYHREQMKPISNWQSEGRASSIGSPAT